MTSIVTRKFRIYNAQQFVESFNEISSASETLTSTPLPDESLNSINYVFIAKSTQWPGGSDTLTNPVDNIDDIEYQNWREMLSATRIDSGDVSSVVSKYPWFTNTAYREYDNTDSTLFDNIVYTAGSDNPANQPFYVTTEEVSTGIRRTYKCLNNNQAVSGSGRASTVEPTHTGFQPEKKSDGYIWKLMYETASKFNTENFIEVRSPAPDGSTISTAGAIYNIKKSASGSGDFLFIAATTVSQTAGDTNTVSIAFTGDETKLVGSSFIVNSTPRVFRVIGSATQNGSNVDLVLDDVITIPAGGTVDFFASPRVLANSDDITTPINALASPVIGWGTSRTPVLQTGTIEEIDFGDLQSTVVSPNVGSGFSRGTANAVQRTDGTVIEDTLRPIIGFPQGHGSSPIEELGGIFAMVSTELSGNIVDSSTNAPTFTIANNFRKVGLLRNPLDSSGNRIFVDAVDQTLRIPISAATDAALTRIEIDEPADFLTNDFTLVQQDSGFSGTIVDHFSFVDTNNVIQYRIRLTEVQGRKDYILDDFTKELQVTNSSGTAVGSPVLASGNPEDGTFRPFSGETIYVEHRDNLRRSSDQTENVRLVIEF